MTMFSFCPAQWATGRIDRAVPDEAVDLTARNVGTGTHRVLDQVAKGVDLDTALADLAADSDTATVIGEITTMVERCVDWELSDPNRPGIIGTEVPLDADIEGVRMIGEIDVLEMLPDGRLAISDYKTGKVPSSVKSPDTDVPDVGAPMFHPNVTRQVVLYAEMLEASGGPHVNVARLLYPTSRQVIEVDLDDERGQLLRREARNFVTYVNSQVVKAFRTGFFPARPSVGRCRSCDFSATCQFAAN